LTTKSYVFSKNGKTILENFMDSRPLVALDFDGTLAPIRPDPKKVRINQSVKSLLRELASCCRIVIITGRARDDLRSLLGSDSIPVIGNHGLEGPGITANPGLKKTVSRWEAELREKFRDLSGIEIENKKLSLSVHYRRAPSRSKARRIIGRVLKELVPAPRIVGGKAVFNLLPAKNGDKGRALKRNMKTARCRRAIYVGDDTTDEDVFRLHDDNIFSIRIGPARNTSACYYLKNQREMERLLRFMIRTLTALRD
jgi:trehalose 6-phosphate phosphatase